MAGQIRFSRRSLLAWAGGLVGWSLLERRPVFGGPIPARRTPERSSTSLASRQEAIRLVPFKKLAPAVGKRVEAILRHPTLYRRLPIQVIYCDPELYVFLVRYPEIIVNMWQLMGVTRVEIHRTSPFVFDAKDGAGTVSTVELVYGTPSKHIFLAEGYYEGPLAPRRVTGRSVLVLSSSYAKDKNQRDRITNRLDVFVQLDNAGVELIAKTLHPLLGRTADTNFIQSAQFLGQVSQVIENNGAGVQRLCTRLTNVDPVVRGQFAALAALVNQRAAERQMMLDSARVSSPAVRLTDRTKPDARGNVSDGTR